MVVFLKTSIGYFNVENTSGSPAEVHREGGFRFNTGYVPYSDSALFSSHFTQCNNGQLLLYLPSLSSCTLWFGSEM